MRKGTKDFLAGLGNELLGGVLHVTEQAVREVRSGHAAEPMRGPGNGSPRVSEDSFSGDVVDTEGVPIREDPSGGPVPEGHERGEEE